LVVSTSSSTERRTSSSADSAGKPSSRHRLGVALGLLAAALFVVGTIGPPLFGRGVFLASDLIYDSYPWRALEDETTLDYDRHGPVGDTVDGGFPAKALFGEAVRDGELQTWNPWMAGGIPLYPTSYGVASPLALTFVLFPAWYAPAVQKLCQLAIAIGFTYLFCRRLGTGRGPALFAGIAFAGSGFMVMWSNWEHTDVAAWIPALFWATERYLQKRSIASLAPLALSLAAMSVALFPAVVFYALYVLVPYVAVRLFALRATSWWERVRTGAGATAGLAAGLGLAAAVLVPFALVIGAQDFSERAQSPYAFLRLPTLVTAVAPRALGFSTQGPENNYYGIFNQTEAISFVGVTTVLLALLAVCLRPPRGTPRGARAVLAVTTLVLGVAVYAGGPVLTFLQHFPPFDNNLIGRSRSVLGFTVAILAGLGTQSLIERRVPRDGWRWLLAGGIAVAALAVAVLAVQRAAQFVPADPNVQTAMRDAFVLPVLVGIGTVGCVVAMWTKRRSVQGVGVAGIVGLLLVESLSFAVPLLPNESRDTLYPETPGIRYLQAEQDGQHFAVEGRTFYGNTATMFGLRAIGFHAFFQPTWKQALLAVDPDSFRLTRTFVTLGSTPEIVGSPLLDRLAVRWWADAPGHLPLGETEPHSLQSASCDNPVNLSEEPATVEVPQGPTVRAVMLQACAVATLPVEATLRAGLQDEATEGRLPLPTVVGPGDLAVPVPVALSSGPSGSTLSVDLVDADGRELPVATTPNGEVAFDLVRAEDDGLRLAFANDLVIYERAAALPRIRWAGRSTVIRDRADRLERLASGQVADDTVVLDSPASVDGDGEPADLSVATDAAEEIRLEVDAAGDGFVVVADALQNGWKATVDGESVELLNADHAGVAIPIEEGQHEVVLRHSARGQRLGLLISFATALLLVAAVAWERVRARRAATPLA
jgi:hypothetical protein